MNAKLAQVCHAVAALDGPLAKALLNIIANWLTNHGDEMLQKLLDMLLSKIIPSDTPTVSGADDPVVSAAAAEVDAALAA